MPLHVFDPDDGPDASGEFVSLPMEHQRSLLAFIVGLPCGVAAELHFPAESISGSALLRQGGDDEIVGVVDPHGDEVRGAGAIELHAWENMRSGLRAFWQLTA